MLSQKARYALRAMVEMARFDGDRATSGEIAIRADAPKKFLEAILLSLCRHGLVISRRGKLGGYSLARPAQDITYAEIIRAVDGPLALAPCASKTAFRKCEDCPDLETCTTRPALLLARDATAGVLEAYTLQRAIDETPASPMD
jgi:Rrf2 family protein